MSIGPKLRNITLEEAGGYMVISWEEVALFRVINTCVRISSSTPGGEKKINQDSNCHKSY